MPLQIIDIFKKREVGQFDSRGYIEAVNLFPFLCWRCTAKKPSKTKTKNKKNCSLAYVYTFDVLFSRIQMIAFLSQL